MENVIEYYAIDFSSEAAVTSCGNVYVKTVQEFSIKFCIGRNMEPLSWRFDSQENRDACLKQIDDLVLNK